MFYTQSDDPPIAAATGLRSHPFQAEATGLLDEVRHAMERNQPDGARAAALRLVTLLAQTAEVGAASARGGLAPWQRRKIDRYVREHLVRPVQIDELAEQIPLSVSHFCRAFKETFGDTPHAYLIRLRLETAQKMMLATAEPLSQIALASGFGDQAHLSKQFRRVVGDSPAAWRRRHLTEAQVSTAAAPCATGTTYPIGARWASSRSAATAQPHMPSRSRCG
jgi:AraC family transcriptional regulator